MHTFTLYTSWIIQHILYILLGTTQFSSSLDFIRHNTQTHTIHSIVFFLAAGWIQSQVLSEVRAYLDVNWNLILQICCFHTSSDKLQWDGKNCLSSIFHVIERRQTRRALVFFSFFGTRNSLDFRWSAACTIQPVLIIKFSANTTRLGLISNKEIGPATCPRP